MTSHTGKPRPMSCPTSGACVSSGEGLSDGEGATGRWGSRSLKAPTVTIEATETAAITAIPLSAVAALLILARRKTIPSIFGDGLTSSAARSRNSLSSRSRSLTVLTFHLFAK